MSLLTNSVPLSTPMYQMCIRDSRMRAAQGSREGGDVFFLFSKPGRYGMIPIEFKKETYDHMDMKRVFLKLSGEALAGPKKNCFDEDTVKELSLIHSSLIQLSSMEDHGV